MDRKRWPRRLTLALLLPAVHWVVPWLALRPWLPRWLSLPAAVALAVGLILLLRRPGRRRLGAAVGLVAAALLVAVLESAPSAGEWVPGQERLPRVTIEGSRVRVEEFRDFRWRTEEDFDAAWRTAEFDLDAVDRCWLGVVPLGDGEWTAHTLLLFTFRDGGSLALSVEARRRPGQRYSPTGGLLHVYPLVYVLGDPRDVLGLRAHAWGDRIHLYPVHRHPERTAAVLRAALERAGGLVERGAFYNTLVDNCTTTLVDHAAEAIPFPWSWKRVLNGRVAEYAAEIGLLDTDLPFPEAKERFRVDERIRRAPEGDGAAWLRAVTGEEAEGGAAPR